MLLREFFRKFKCFVGTAVFNNNYFRGIGLFFEKMKHLLQGVGQAVLLIVSRNDDGQKRIQSFIRTLLGLYQDVVEIM